jgi:hypothetical protein
MRRYKFFSKNYALRQQILTFFYMYRCRMKKKTIRRPLNEVFKKKFKKFFERFAVVKTEFEIVGLPRKFDILIIETDTPFRDRLEIFSYFKKYNIVDFKSEGDELTVDGLNKVCYYFYAFLLREYAAKYANTTVTIVSTFRPFIISDEYEHEQVKKGIFTVKGLTKVDLYVVVVDELGEKDKEEYQLLRTFVSKNHRRSMIADVFKHGTVEEQEDLILLYGQEVFQTMEEENIIMDVLERRAYDVAKQLGIVQKVTQKVTQRVTKKVKRKVLKESREEFLKLLEAEKQKAEAEKQKAEAEKQKAEAEKQKAEVEKQKADRKAKREARKVKLKTAIAMKKKGLNLDTISEIVELDKKFLEKLFIKSKLNR